MKKILTASLVAMMAVSAANADIASTNYVGKVADTKVDLDQTADNKNKAMITNANGIVEPGQIIEGMIANDAVTTAKIKDLNVTTGKLAADAVTNAKLAADAVKSENIVNETIVNDDISPNAKISISKIEGLQTALDSKESGLGYTPEDVANKYKTTDNVTINDANKDTLYPSMGRVQTYVETVKKELSDGVAGDLETKVDIEQGDENANLAMVTDQYGDVTPGVIIEGMIAANAVTEGKLATNAVTTAKIKDLNVTTGKLADEAVTEGKLADGAVTTVKIKDLNVTTGKLADAAVTEGKLAADAVTTVKIKNLNVTEGKLADGAVTTAKIKDLNVTTGKLADEAVTEGKLADEAVTEGKLADEAVTTDKIKDLNVTKLKLSQDVQTTLDNAVQRSQVGMGVDFTVSEDCKAKDVVCSLTIKGTGTTAVAQWEVVQY